MNTGFAIALAWPETLCKQAGSWYDGIMNYLGFSNNHYYKVGHAAVVLIEAKTGKCFYFDFGRYHAPFGYGRVRDEETDHDLKILEKAHIANNRIENLENILKELLHNESCHGVGNIYASYISINFEKAYLKAKSMRNISPWRYGPFIWKGTNCSRFVRTVILAGNPTLIAKMRLALPFTISPTPLGNVKSLSAKCVIEKKPNLNFDNHLSKVYA